MMGQAEPQNPSTLPRGKGSIEKPVPGPLPPATSRMEAVGADSWRIRGGWELATAPNVQGGGKDISQPSFAAKNWMAATVPGTVLTTMIDRGIYPDPDYGLNNLAIPESLAHQDYWYRVEFKAPPQARGRRLTLTFEGINYAAEVWLNGQDLGGVTGAFIRGRFDVTSFISASRENVLAVRVSPPPHAGIANEESIRGRPWRERRPGSAGRPDFRGNPEGWDWIPSIRDRNTGIWQDVTLTATGSVEIGDLHVVTTLPKPDRSEADIEIEAPSDQHGTETVEGELTATFDDVKVTKHVKLTPGETVCGLSPRIMRNSKCSTLNCGGRMATAIRRCTHCGSA